MRPSMEGEPIWDLLFGRSDAIAQMHALYTTTEGLNRLFTMTFDAGRWTMSREDPDSYQRFVADIESDQISGRWEASEDEGRSWHKDFDLLFK